MTLTQDKNKLTQLAEESPLLSRENRELLRRQLSLLDEEEVKKLTDIFLMEQQKLARIDVAYDTKELAVKAEYLKALTDFEHAGVQHALAVTEKGEEQKKEQQLEMLLKGMEAPKPKKKFPWKIIVSLLAFGALIAALYYYFYVYAPSA